MAASSSTTDSTDSTETDLEEPLLSRGRREEGDAAPSSDHLTTEDQQQQQQQQQRPPLPSVWRLVMLGKPEFCVLTVAGIFMVASQLSQLFIPLLVGRAYDDLVDDDLDRPEKMRSINGLMVWALVIHASGAICQGFRSSLMGIAGERIVARMRTTLYASILRQEIAFFDATKSGELVSRLGSDTMVVKRAIASSWAEVSLGVLRLGATLAVMFSLSPKLAGLTVGSTLGVFAVCLPFGRALGRLSKAYQETLGEAQNLPTETIGAMRTVKSFGAETRESDRYESIIGTPSYCPSRHGPPSTFRIGCDQSLVRACFGFCIFGGGFGAMYATLWYGFALVSEGELRLGDLSAFQVYIFGIGGMLAHMSSSISNLIEARHASQRIFGLLDREPKIRDDHGGDDGGDSNGRRRAQPPPTRSSGSNRNNNDDDDDDAKISFSNVSFSYPTRPGVTVLRNVSLTIPRNRTTAIVGPSGAGKSTVISLLERFYDAETGSISLDGRDIREIPLRDLRRNIGYVQQEPTLFGVSVRDNLRYGSEDPSSVTDEALLEACKTANAYDFVTRLPRGLDEVLGERGVTLSGGQKQRLAIARAILDEPDVLLLDEATSALDAESEYLVQKAMDAASKGRTVVVVAHRLSTVQKADQIVVLEDHALADAGTHEELHRRCSTYRNLIARQSFAQRAAAAADPVVVRAAATRGGGSGRGEKRRATRGGGSSRTAAAAAVAAVASPALRAAATARTIATTTTTTTKATNTPDRSKTKTPIIPKSNTTTTRPKAPVLQTPDRQRKMENPITNPIPSTVPRRSRSVKTPETNNINNNKTSAPRNRSEGSPKRQAEKPGTPANGKTKAAPAASNRSEGTTKRQAENPGTPANGETKAAAAAAVAAPTAKTTAVAAPTGPSSVPSPSAASSMSTPSRGDLAQHQQWEKLRKYRERKKKELTPPRKKSETP